MRSPQTKIRIGGLPILAAFLLIGGLLRADQDDIKAADWPLFRGNPLQTGVATSTLPDDLEIRWKFKAKDSIEATAAIANGIVYVGSMDGHLYALSLATGKEKWSYKAAPIEAPPSVHGFAVFVGDTDGILHCVERATGKKRWTFDAGGEVTSGGNFAGDTVIFGAFDANLHCLDQGGKELWKFNIPGGEVKASPVVANGRTYASGCDSTLHVLDAKTGKEISSVPLDGQTGASPAVAGDELFVGTIAPGQMLAIDLKKGEVKWRFEAQKPDAFYSSPAVTADFVVVGSRDKQIHALDRKTGKEMWHVATGRKVDSSPVVVGQRVFVGSDDGNLYVLDLNNGTVLKKFNLGAPITASPAVAENCLVIGTQDGVLYCFGKK